MDVVFDTFEVPMTQTATEQKIQKKKIADLIEIPPLQKYWLHTEQA